MGIFLIILLAFVIVVFWIGRSSANQPLYSCTQAYAEGIHDIKRGSPLYRPQLDRDKDGVACEE